MPGRAVRALAPEPCIACKAEVRVYGVPPAVYLTRCLHEAIVAAIGRATDRRDDRLV